MHMDHAFLFALQDSTKALFEGMLGVPVCFEPPERPAPRRKYDVSCVITFSGGVEGPIVLGFWEDSALRIAAALGGESLAPRSADFADAIGELTNMIAGGAKSRLLGTSASISCPSVIMAEGHIVSTPRAVGPWMEQRSALSPTAACNAVMSEKPMIALGDFLSALKSSCSSRRMAP